MGSHDPSVLIINTNQPFLLSLHDELYPGEPRPRQSIPQSPLTLAPAREARSVDHLPAPPRTHPTCFAGEGTYANVFKVRFFFSVCTSLIFNH
jgi:hypothetical protein